MGSSTTHLQRCKEVVLVHPVALMKVPFGVHCAPLKSQRMTSYNALPAFTSRVCHILRVAAVQVVTVRNGDKLSYPVTRCVSLQRFFPISCG
jgi:hypothetical protein